MSSDYDSPVEGMSEDEFLYRTMNDEDEMYMGDEEDEMMEEEYSSDDDDDDEAKEAEEYAFYEMIEEIETALSDAWVDETLKVQDEIDYDWCVENVKILSNDGYKYTVSYDLYPDSDEGKIQWQTFTSVLKKESDDTFSVINLKYN